MRNFILKPFLTHGERFTVTCRRLTTVLYIQENNDLLRAMFEMNYKIPKSTHL